LLNRLANKSILFRCYHFAADETGYIRKDAEGQFRFVNPSLRFDELAGKPAIYPGD
jgi:hypothetical protein